MRVVTRLLVGCVLLTACSVGDTEQNASSSSSIPPTSTPSLELRSVIMVGAPTCNGTQVRGAIGDSYCLADGAALMIAADFHDGHAELDAFSNTWVVVLRVRDDSVEKWANVLDSYVGQQVAIVVDDQVVSAPVINPGIPPESPILVTGDFTRSEAETLAEAFPS